jgi:Methanogen output domain 1
MLVASARIALKPEDPGEQENMTMIEHRRVTACFPPLVALPVSLDRDSFLTSLMGELASTLQDVVGPDEASGCMSAAGERVGELINEGYKSALAVRELPRSRISEVLVDVSRRIASGFDVVEEDDNGIVMINRTCSCGDKLQGSDGMCVMTANAFGVIVAENLGYARVLLERKPIGRIPACLLRICLQPPAGSDEQGREYFRQGRRQRIQEG